MVIEPICTSVCDPPPMPCHLPDSGLRRAVEIAPAVFPGPVQRVIDALALIGRVARIKAGVRPELVADRVPAAAGRHVQLKRAEGCPVVAREGVKAFALCHSYRDRQDLIPICAAICRI